MLMQHKLKLGICGGLLWALPFSMPALAENSQTGERAYILSNSLPIAAPVEDHRVREKQQADYDYLRRSVVALTQALEQQLGVKAQTLLAKSARAQRRADKLARHEDYPEARRHLKPMYDALKTEIARLKNNASQSELYKTVAADYDYSDSQRQQLQHGIATNQALLASLEAEVVIDKKALVAAQDRLKQTQTALHAGELNSAEQLLQQADGITRELAQRVDGKLGDQVDVSPVPLASSPADLLQKEYQRRHQSTQALIKAAKQVALERNRSFDNLARVEMQLRQAEAHMSAGKAEVAMKRLDQAYLSLKQQMAETLSH